jgi:hypothetical protein
MAYLSDISVVYIRATGALMFYKEHIAISKWDREAREKKNTEATHSSPDLKPRGRQLTKQRKLFCSAQAALASLL